MHPEQMNFWCKINVVKRSTHARGSYNRTETDSHESVLPGGLFVSIGRRAADLALGHVSFVRLECRTRNDRVEIVWRSAPRTGICGGSLNSEPSIGAVYQYRDRACGLRRRLQLLG